MRGMKRWPEDLTWSRGESLGPPPPALARTDSGLIYFSDFTHTDGNLDGTDSWAAMQGSWAVDTNQAKVTTNGSFDRIMRLSPTAAAMVVETRCRAPSGYIGHCVLALDTDDYWYSIIAPTDRQYHSVVAGSTHSGINAPGGSGFSHNTWHIWKSSFRSGKLLGQWLDKTLKVGPAFNASGVTGNTSASGFGLVVYQAQNALWDYIAVYKSTLINMTGLSGTMAWRLMNASDVQVAASAAQSGGSAEKEIGDLIDCPFTGYIELHTSTAFSSLVARYPTSGNATDIYGGATFAYS